MKFIKTKKGLAVVGVVAAMAIAAVGAYAYFTANGSGTGTAAVGTSGTITLTGTSVGAVTPGGQTGNVSFSVVNAGSGNQLVGTVSLASVAAFSGPGFTNPIPTGTGPGKCDTTKFTMAPVVENQDVPPGTTALAHNGILVMADDPSNSQDGCKLAVLQLTLTSS